MTDPKLAFTTVDGVQGFYCQHRHPYPIRCLYGQVSLCRLHFWQRQASIYAESASTAELLRLRLITMTSVPKP